MAAKTMATLQLQQLKEEAKESTDPYGVCFKMAVAYDVLCDWQGALKYYTLATRASPPRKKRKTPEEKIADANLARKLAIMTAAAREALVMELERQAEVQEKLRQQAERERIKGVITEMHLNIVQELLDQPHMSSKDVKTDSDRGNLMQTLGELLARKRQFGTSRHAFCGERSCGHKAAEEHCHNPDGDTAHDESMTRPKTESKGLSQEPNGFRRVSEAWCTHAFTTELDAAPTAI
ncbi:hypothetical protein JKP88DRAFT_250150 [Tribonema minus]|uniref:Uncharacterized protein n=1 Tax=Tribonema minus TaxID=303371 RepID=A0A835YH94_9STRA|nr:hypothetical protein JKP88DRAFT_250150 [Tribonema minus]